MAGWKPVNVAQRVIRWPGSGAHRGACFRVGCVLGAPRTVAAIAFLAASILGAVPTLAQQFPIPLNQTSIDQQVSADTVSNFVFTSPNSQNKTLLTLSVKNAAASGYVMVFDAAALPGNGAVTSCTSSATTRPCLMWCVPLGANSSLSAQWGSPLRFTTGVVAGFSTTGCDSITASATAKFMGQAP